MRILLLSDIHSNLEALKACLEIAPQHDAIVNLGDIVGYGASPNEVTEQARTLGGAFIRGNHDKVVSGIESGEDFNPTAAVAALWNRGQLTAENLAWLRALPKGPAFLDGLADVAFVHGAPGDEDRYMLTASDAAQEFSAFDVNITFFGHTHIQGAFRLRDVYVNDVRPGYATDAKKESWDFQLEPGARYMINPGSIGQPRDDDWRAGFALFDSENLLVTFCRVPYDVTSAQQKILTARLPPRLATRLATGQ